MAATHRSCDPRDRGCKPLPAVRSRGCRPLPQTGVALAVLSLLADPQSYAACTWDLLADDGHRAYWLNLFRAHIHTIADLIRSELGPAAAGRVDAFLAEYFDGLHILDVRPDAWGSLNVLKLCLYQQGLLKRHGFPDPFAQIKAKETHKAIELYPQVVRELDALRRPERMEALARAIFAGNEFDLGCEATTARYHNDGHDFHEAMERIPPRPWPEDDFDAWLTMATGRQPAYRQVFFFVDNAGADAVLGCIPLARDLLAAGASVTLAANSEPSLNDITIGELNEALGDLRQLDPPLERALAGGRLQTVASGCGAPLIDLSQVSEACHQAARGADLLILEGMGRSVETNRTARFTCDALRVALIKDPFVASQLGVALFSPVWRFDKPSGHALERDS